MSSRDENRAPATRLEFRELAVVGQRRVAANPLERKRRNLAARTSPYTCVAALNIRHFRHRNVFSEARGRYREILRPPGSGHQNDSITKHRFPITILQESRHPATVIFVNRAVLLLKPRLLGQRSDQKNQNRQQMSDQHDP